MNRKYLRSVQPCHSKGAAMLYVIVFIMLVSLLIGLMTTQYITHRRSLYTAKRKIQDLYTVEAGVKKALWYLSGNTDKGITWRTGTVLQDTPIIEKVFFALDEQVRLSVLDDCGFVRITSETFYRPGAKMEVTIGSHVPEAFRTNLYITAPKPLILQTGSYVRGMVKVNKTPLFRGGGIEGVIETDESLSLPPILTQSFTQSIAMFQYWLTSPHVIDRELFSPQVFSPENPLPCGSLYVNDAVLVENQDMDSIWTAGNHNMIISTADIQISGYTRLDNVCLLAYGSVSLLDSVQVIGSRIYSEAGIHLGHNVRYSGVLMAPQITVTDHARVIEPSLLYCGGTFKSGMIVLSSNIPQYCTIINLCSDKDSRIEIPYGSTVNGFVYSKTPIMHRGTINGYVFCNGFYEETTYEDTTNHNILSGVINPPEDDQSLTIPLLFHETSDFRIIKWHEN